MIDFLIGGTNLQERVMSTQAQISPPPVKVAEAWGEMTGGIPFTKPDPKAIARLSKEDRKSIAEYRKEMPPAMNEAVLFAGDVADLLADPGWDPDRLQLDESSRLELAQLVREYRYFARLSPMEWHAVVSDLIPHRRESGAFIEYNRESLPRPAGPLAASFAEPSDKPGMKRMYFFYENEHKELFHQSRVEKEQALRVFVDIFRLIQERGQFPDSDGYWLEVSMSQRWRLTGLLTLTVFFVASELSAQTRPTIDLRHPEAHGITELTLDWGASFGWQPHHAGDVDGDGFGDFIALQARGGSCCEEQLFGEHGAAWIVYGGPRESLESQGAFTQWRRTELQYFKDPVSRFFTGICDEGITTVGDLDADGFDDLLISFCQRSWEGAENTGGAIVVFGASNLPAVISLADPPVRHLRILSREEEAWVGIEAGLAGDLDLDGRLDLAISAVGVGTEDDERGAGRVFIIYGGFRLDQPLELAGVGGAVRGSVLTGAFGNHPLLPSSGVGDGLGNGHGALEGALDVNGDGFDDLLVGAPTASRAIDRGGAVYVVHGGEALPASLSISQIETFGIELQGVSGLSRTGDSIARAGDVDGDSLDDLLIGAAGSGGGAVGEAWLVYGAPGGLRRARLDDPSLRTTRFLGSPAPGSTLPQPDVYFGWEVEGLGDLDGDSFADIFISAQRTDVRFETHVGAGYVVRGGTALPDEALDDEIGLTIPGVRIDGPLSNRYFGKQAESGGDLDLDGFNDLLVTAPSYTVWDIPPGESCIYVCWGSDLLRTEALEVVVSVPEERSASGGEEIAIHGRGFRGGERVFVGDAESPRVEAMSGAELGVEVPPGDAGTVVDILVERGGQRATLRAGLRYGPERDFRDLMLDEEWLRGRSYAFTRIDDLQHTGPLPGLGPGGGRGFLPLYLRDLDGDGSDELLALECCGAPSTLPRSLILRGGERLPEVLRGGETLGLGLGAELQGADFRDWLEFQVAFPGDLDGDGFEEIATGGELPTGGRGLLLAGREWSGQIDLGDEALLGRIELLVGPMCGMSVVATADIDGSGLPDIALGSQHCEGLEASLFLYFDVDGVDGGGAIAREPQAVIHGDPRTFTTGIGEVMGPGAFGYALAANDINGDRIGDLVIGSRFPSMGEVFILLGSGREGYAPEASILDYERQGRVVRVGLGAGVQRQVKIGEAVASGFDFNGDGLGDFAVGARWDGRDFHGAVFLVFGSETFGREVRAIDLDDPSPAVVRIDGPFANDQISSASALGDVNGDGYGDVGIVTAAYKNTLPRAYVVFGGAASPGTLDLESLGLRGFKITGKRSMVFSGSVYGPMAGGDFDGDQKRDIALGVSKEGKLESWVIYGGTRRTAFVRGEVNRDGRIDLSDAVGALAYLFLGGATPACLDAADVNDNGGVDLSDAVYLLGHLYLGTAAPPPPFPGEGEDPTADEIRC